MDIGVDWMSCSWKGQMKRDWIGNCGSKKDKGSWNGIGSTVIREIGGKLELESKKG